MAIKTTQIKSRPFFRSLDVDRGLINKEARTVELTFSSEKPYERFIDGMWGLEVLDHSNKSVHLDRLNDGAPLLVNHDTSQQVGVLERAWIGKDRRGKALVRFGKSATAEEIFNDVQDGIRKNVSVGYVIERIEVEEPTDGERIFKVVEWSPLELSICSIPADNSIGIGRATETENEITIESQVREDAKEKTNMEEKKEPEVKPEEIAAEMRAKEMARVKELRSIAKAFSVPCDDAIEKGTSVDDYRKEVMEKMKISQNTVIQVGEDRETLAPWKKFSEFLYALRFNPSDKRLLSVMSRTQSMGVGASGGFALPEQFRETLLQLTPQDAHIRPRATVIPPGDPPDAKITIPALDQSTAHDVYGGVAVSWIQEGGAKPETQFYLRQIELEPKEAAAYMDITDKLLRNWDACAALVERQFRLAIISAEDNAFLTGNGVGRPLGILNAACAASIGIARAGAGAIAYADLRNMFARFMMRGTGGVWIGSQTVIPQLMAIEDDASVMIWQPNAREGMPGTIFGMPLVISERVPVLGSRGDLSIVDATYYLIKDGSGPIFESTNARRFIENISTFKCTFNVDGQPWLNTPVPLEVGVANTVSPFVVLV